MRLDVTEAQLRRLVDGAVRDAFNTHPEYLTRRGRAMALNGVAKRVTGSLKGFAAQAAGGRDPAATGAVARSIPAARCQGERLTL